MQIYIGIFKYFNIQLELCIHFIYYKKCLFYKFLFYISIWVINMLTVVTSEIALLLQPVLYRSWININSFNFLRLYWLAVTFQMERNIPTFVHKNPKFFRSLDSVKLCSFTRDFINKYKGLLKDYNGKGFSVALMEKHLYNALVSRSELVHMFVYPNRQCIKCFVSEILNLF